MSTTNLGSLKPGQRFSFNGSKSGTVYEVETVACLEIQSISKKKRLNPAKNEDTSTRINPKK